MALGDEAYTSHPEQLLEGGPMGFLNVGEHERWPSLIAGALLALYGLSKRSILGIVVAMLGGVLLYRGTTGHCPVYHALGVNTYHPQRDGFSERVESRKAVKPVREERVEEASWESFPASDAPSWSGGAIT